MNSLDLAAHAMRVAEELAAPVFPVLVYSDPGHPSKTIKRPLVKGWANGAAVTNAQGIEALFADHPTATHVGIQTGQRSRLLVVDLDGKVAMRWWGEHHDVLPTTRTVRTRRENGRHLYYRLPVGVELRNSAGKIADGVDIRASGGFAVDWTSETGPATEDVTDAPQALIDLVRMAGRHGLQKAPNQPGGLQNPHKIGVGARHDALKSVGASYRRKGLRGTVLKAALDAWNIESLDPPLDHKEVGDIADYFSNKEGDDAVTPSATAWGAPAFTSYGEAFDPAAIPLRQWLIRGRYARGEGTVVAGPPGTNKSSLLLVDAVQIAVERSLLGDDIQEGGGVLFFVGEDRRRDFESRLAAICAHYRIEPRELGDRLHVVYQSEINVADFTLAQMFDQVATLNTQMFDWVRQFPGLVALFIDPMLSWHRLMEADNGAMDYLCVALRALAAQANIAVAFDHHVTKVSMYDHEAHVRNLAAIRGAGAIAAGTRWAFTMAKLKPETAAQYGIPEEDRRIYRRLDTLKASYGPDDDEPRLLRIDSVRIANGETVGILTAVDANKLKTDGQERRQAAEQERGKALAEALARMLREQRPRSAKAAAVWLATREPGLFVGKKGDPLTDDTIRKRLAVVVGTGIATTHNGQPARIVVRVTGSGNGARQEVDFEQGVLA